MRLQVIHKNVSHTGFQRLPYSIDSRTVQPGDVYVCLPKGDVYCKDAYKKGAVGTLYMTREQCADWAAFIYDNPSKDMVVIGVTGTNGKTSVCHFLGQAIETLGGKPYVLGTLNAALTTPESLTIVELMASHRASGGTHFIMEVSSHAIAQHRVNGIHFDVTVLTNITQDHLDYHGTFENYKHAKLSFIEGFGDKKLYPDSNQNFNQAVNLPFNSPLLGEFSNRNLRTAMHVLLALGYEQPDINQALEKVTSPPGRFDIVSQKRGVFIVDYAHTPDGVENVLLSARQLVKPGKKLYIVVGCGGDRDRGKRPKMADISVRLADKAWFTQDNPRTEDPVQIMDDMMAGIGESEKHRVHVVQDRFEAIKQAVLAMSEGDVLVVAGKGHETYQVLKDKTIDFDDRNVVKQIIHEYFD